MANVDNSRKNKKEQIAVNGRLIMIIMALIVTCITFRLWYIQIVKGDYYNKKSQDNRIRTRRIRALRGIITDRNGEILADNSLAFNLQLIPENIDEIEHVARLLATQVDDLDAETVINIYNKTPYSLYHKPLTLKKNLDPSELARVEARKFELPGILIETEPIREYPYDEICSHIIGYLGFINDQELALPAYLSYARDDLVGRSGIEARYQEYLRGLDGIRQVEVNARGRELSAHTTTPAQAGQNLELTIDIDLQQYAFELLGGEVGSLVAINPENGEILALVSTPSFSNNLFATRISAKDWQTINDDPQHPLQNRPIQGRYAPGSTIKPLIAAVALTDQVITEKTSFTCTGSMTLGQSNFRCWNRYGHGKVDLFRSLAESCDVYYYNLATRMPIDRIAAYGATFGLGKLSGIELQEEKSGLMPCSSWKLKNVHAQWYTGDTISVCIGQGYLTTTPLQVAAMYTVFANRGIYYRPHLVKRGIELPTHSSTDNISSAGGTRVEISEPHMQAIREALWQVVNDKRGTAYKSRITRKGWEMAGKTGTAQVVKQNLEDLKSGEETPWRFRDHAWFAAFAPYNDPKIAIAVLIEHGGHGGSTAAPIAKQAIEFYLDKIKQKTSY
ncbi:MAG: penicillin-binding protein 2 [Deltaproteobacteria bacterium]|nr:penicillin-binding protein 2 [Deltaproteobacteria bacterium]